MTYDVLVPFGLDDDAAWNLVCAKLLENFGLPGNNYVTRIREDGIVFSFKDQEDAFRAQLMI